MDTLSRIILLLLFICLVSFSNVFATGSPSIFILPLLIPYLLEGIAMVVVLFMLISFVKKRIKVKTDEVEQNK